jgi:hypothetical protein
VFDPGYIHYDQDHYPGTDPSSLSDPLFAPHESTRELLPWGHSDGSAVDPLTKEERMRMLEREFGPNSKKVKGKGVGDFMDENGKPLIGTVDARGYLVTQGPKKRAATSADFICSWCRYSSDICCYCEYTHSYTIPGSKISKIGY